MLVLRVDLLARRFHATPWGSHVNEGQAEWPPSPWRLHRALVAAWHRTGQTVGQGTLRDLLTALSQQPPHFHLPQVVQGHTRHFAPSGDGTRLMLDACVRTVCADDPLFIAWPDLFLDDDQQNALDHLLQAISYLGRAESLCRIRRCPETRWQGTFGPREGTVAGGEGRPSFLLCPLPGATLEQYSARTSELRRQGWTRPPGSGWVSYGRLEGTAPTPPPPSTPSAITLVTYALAGKPVSRTQTLSVADGFRQALLKAGAVSPTLTGKQAEQAREDGHQHLHILPYYPPGELHLDRLHAWAPEGFSPADLDLLQSIERFPHSKGEQRLTVWTVSTAHDLARSTATVWRSATPYLRTRHPKTGSEEELQREITAECASRGLPAPELQVQPGQEPRYQIRRGPRPTPPGPPLWLTLEFPTPVPGPLALGHTSHFGLGRFEPGR